MKIEKEIKRANKNLVRALADLEKEITEAREAIANGNPQLASKGSSGFISNATAAREAVAALDVLKALEEK